MPFDDFPEPTVTDLLRQLYGLLAPVGRDDPAARYLKASGLPRDRNLRVMRLDGVPLAQPAFGCAALLVAPVTRYDGAPCGMAGRWLDAAGKACGTWPESCWWFTSRAAGAAVRFGRPENHLALAVDIETALKVRQRMSLPCWASVLPWRLPDVAVPSYVEHVTIYADPLSPAPEAADEAREWLERRGHSVATESTWELLQ